MMRFTGVEAVGFAAGDSLRNFAHRAFWARAIFRLEAADIIRVGWVACPVGTEPFNDSIAEIALSNFSTCDCASRRSARSC